MRRSIRWPDDKLLACTFTIALEAFRKSGRFKKDPKIPVNLCSISHANYGGNAGIWRLVKILARNNVRAMVLANGLAVQKWLDAMRAVRCLGVDPEKEAKIIATGENPPIPKVLSI